MYDPASQAAATGALRRLGVYLVWLIISLAVVVVAFTTCGWGAS